MNRDEWLEIAKTVGGMLLALIIGAVIVLGFFWIGGFPPG